ncbi:uncharacterized protein LOC118454825 [Neolamprologus brichardi]|uniref:uncharacterized protein LOC118454825 n=1 Tax=Neolamprologus brichardi TaxID=32507 RepID=UPI001643C9C7|nr:uncharacterized protein LOC118454825 [Neolamprologus brichardi]
MTHANGQAESLRAACILSLAVFYIATVEIFCDPDMFFSVVVFRLCCNMSSGDDERNAMIITLFNKGLKQREISCVLNSYGHKISERHLRRVLKLLGLKRRCPQRPFTEIHKAVESEMKQWSPEQGIRAMVKRVRDVRGERPCYRDDVANIMRDMDASGLQRRSPGKKKIPRRNYISCGPNDTWHIDGNDKLKFFGMWIHLGIDG